MRITVSRVPHKTPFAALLVTERGIPAGWSIGVLGVMVSVGPDPRCALCDGPVRSWQRGQRTDGVFTWHQACRFGPPTLQLAGNRGIAHPLTSMMHEREVLAPQHRERFGPVYGDTIIVNESDVPVYRLWGVARMNRRGFLKILGTGAAVGAVAAVAPSQVFPFRKIFLPGWETMRRWVGIDWGTAATESAFTYYDEMGRILYERPGGIRLVNIPNPPELGDYLGLSKTPYPGPLNEAAVEAIELERFAKEIPDLLFKDRTLYRRFKSANRVNMLDLSHWGRAEKGQHEWYLNADQAKALEAVTKELPELLAATFPPLYGEPRHGLRVPMRINRSLGLDKLDDQLQDITRQANDLLTEG